MIVACQPPYFGIAQMRVRHPRPFLGVWGVNSAERDRPALKGQTGILSLCLDEESPSQLPEIIRPPLQQSPEVP